MCILDNSDYRSASLYLSTFIKSVNVNIEEQCIQRQQWITLIPFSHFDKLLEIITPVPEIVLLIAIVATSVVCEFEGVFKQDGLFIRVNMVHVTFKNKEMNKLQSWPKVLGTPNKNTRKTRNL